MRIAIDARELLGRPTGVGRFLTEILGAWAHMPSARAHDIVLCAPDTIDGAPETVSLLVEPGGAFRGGGTAWEQLVLPRLARRARADVLFAPAYTSPLLCPAPVVVAVHDVSFAAHPEWFTRREGVRRRTLARLSARRAAAVLTISEHSKTEIVRWLGVRGSKIAVAYPGATTLAAAQGGERENLVLFVGSLFARRHVPELIHAFSRLASHRPDLRLEIVGDNRTVPRIDFEHIAQQSGAGSRISIRSYVADEILAMLYGRARAFVFLSDYEGFGLTPVEALAAGVPIVVLDTPIAREICGDAAIYVPSPDPPVIQDALERVLFDEDERRRILDAAQRILPRYSWGTCAERVLSVLLECGARRERR